MSDIEKASRFIPFPPGIAMVRPMSSEQRAASKPEPKPTRIGWSTFPHEVMGVRDSLELQAKIIARQNPEEPVSSPWEAARDQAKRS